MNAPRLFPSSSLFNRIGGHRSRSQKLLLLLLGAGLAASVSVFLYGRQAWGPGARHYRKGVEYADAHQYALAEQEWIQGVREDPKDSQCLEMLGSLYTSLRRYTAAAQCFGAAALRSPGNGALWLELVHAEERLGASKQALIAAKHAVEVMPDDPDTLELYGVLQAKDTDRTGAIASLQRAHALRPDDSVFLLTLASAELANLDLADVERDLGPYLQAHPDDPEANYMMGMVYSRKPATPENLRAGIAAAERARAGMPSDGRVYPLLGQLYLAADRPTDALSAYRTGDQLHPNSEEMLHGLVECYSRLGDNRKMAETGANLQAVSIRHNRIENLKHIMAVNDKNAAAGLALARLTEEDGDYEKARLYYEELQRLLPNDAQVHAALIAFAQRYRAHVVPNPSPSSQP